LTRKLRALIVREWEKEQMKFKSAILATILLACVSSRADTIQETLNPASTYGHYFGGIYFTFNVAGDSRSWNGTTNHVFWNTSNSSTQFNVNYAQLNLTLGLGYAEGPDELNLTTSFNINDPMMQTYGQVGSNGSQNDSGLEERGFLFQNNVANDVTYTLADASRYYDYTRAENLTSTYGFTVNINFDGAVGVGTGSWYLDYQPPAQHLGITVVPEPSVWMLGAIGLGTLCLCRRKIKTPA
jgi:hypothetical protein